MEKIPFNKPFLTGSETEYIRTAVMSGKISGNGIFTKRCQDFFEKNYGFGKCLLTTSCTDALEMSAMLCNLSPDDEVIVPSFTFVSTALAFVREGAKIVFADSCCDNPNIDHTKIENLITPKTKVIVVVHYGGVACDMDSIMEIAHCHGLMIVEDCAHSFHSFYKGKPLGSFGDFATFSFHETKNIICGEGGMLVVNNEKYFRRAEVIWEKGTNRADFSRGIVNKYEWIDTGSSFLPSEITSAFLWGQLENYELIQNKRISLWNEYFNKLHDRLKNIEISSSNITSCTFCNAHLYYILCRSNVERTNLIKFLSENGVCAVSHYLSLHKSPFFTQRCKNKNANSFGIDNIPTLPYSDMYEQRLLRLPMFYNLEKEQVNYICDLILRFYNIIN